MDIVLLYDRKANLVDRLSIPAGRRPDVIVWHERAYVRAAGGDASYSEAELYDADLADQIPF